MNLRNVDQPFKLRAASRRRGAFLRPQLLQTAYQFQSALRQLFKVYESESEVRARAGEILEHHLNSFPNTSKTN